MNSTKAAKIFQFTGLEFKSKKAEKGKGHQADAQLEVLKYPVMGVEVRKHAFKDTAPASYKIEKLVGSSTFTSGLVFIELTLRKNPMPRFMKF